MEPWTRSQVFAFGFKMTAPQKYLEYLKFAEDARRIALTVPPGDVRQSFEKLADGWQQLAEQVLRAEKDQKAK